MLESTPLELHQWPNASNETKGVKFLQSHIPCEHLSSTQLTYSHLDLHQPRILYWILRLHK